MFGSSQWMYSSGAASFFDHQIDGSLRFAKADSAALTRTPSSTGNRQTWTFSAWVKLSNFGHTSNSLFQPHNGGNESLMRFNSSNKLQIYNDGGGSLNLQTVAVFRDVSAWYHVVFRVDTTQATASNRVRIYVNGEQQSVTGTNPSQNANLEWNLNCFHTIGRAAYTTSNDQYFDGYMAEINHVDGQSLAPTSFGETKSGVWIPKAYSGSYGTNGFHLEFAGNANDSSGNGNNWTANNISSYDYVPDSPTNNFATLNPIWRTGNTSQGWFSRVSSVTVSQGNLQQVGVGGDVPSGMPANMAVPSSSGKYYWEIRHVVEPSSSISWFGVVGDDYSTIQTASTTSGRGFTSGDISMIGFDADNGRVKFGKNGTWYDDPAVSTDGTATTASVTYLPFGAGNSGGSAHNMVFNFGQDSTFVGGTTAGGNSDANGFGDFKYTPPTGYLALSTANLPVAEAVDPAEDNSPQDYFGTVLYTGNASTRSITGVGFQPDLVWGKKRVDADGFHSLFDVVRGPQKVIFTNSTNAEATETLSLTSFDSDGWTMGSWGGLNENTKAYVVWNWKANGSGVSNSEGSDTVTLSASPESGFSIVTSGSTIGNFGHGLDQAPEMIITKSRNSTGNWHTWHKDLGTGTSQKYIYINSNNGAAGPDNYEYVAVNDTTVTLQGSSAFNNPIVYMFHSVEGFSKVGSYTGNGSTDGAFVYTGFSPAMVILKRYDSSGNWYIFDTARGEDNYLTPHTSGSEGTFDYWDIVSNGFKLRWGGSSENANGGKYMYIAFAENPFKYANAR